MESCAPDAAAEELVLDEELTEAALISAEVNAHVGRQVRGLREAAGESLKDLAAKVRKKGQPMSISRLSCLERGKDAWSVALAAVVARCLGVPTRRLFEL